MTDVSLPTLTFALLPTKVTRPALYVHKACFAGMSSHCTIMVYTLENSDVKTVGRYNRSLEDLKKIKWVCGYCFAQDWSTNLTYPIVIIDYVYSYISHNMCSVYCTSHIYRYYVRTILAKTLWTISVINDLTKLLI